MQTDHKQKMCAAASILARRVGHRVDDQIDFAVDLLLLTNLALRATDFLGDPDACEAAANTADFAVEIIAAARRLMDEPGRANG